jgi:two-component system cell cycle response regulator DivK
MVIQSIRQYKWTGKKVLIIEDDPTSAFLLTEILQHTGIEILTVAEGRDAFDTFRKNKDIDIVLLDLLLPEVNGFELAGQMKEIRPVPIIAQSAYAMIEDRDRALAAGCDAHLPKPINTFELLGVMHRYLYGKDSLPSV